MASQSSDKRPRLREIVRGNAADFQRTWNETEASSGFDPLPPGLYRCLITDGRLFTSKANATPGFKVEFQVIGGPHAGRKVWLDVWLSNKALSMAKGELAKLGITNPDQLEHPLPPGLTADVTVVRRTDDNGETFNRVKTFKVIAADVPADDYSPDDTNPRESEVDAGHLDAVMPASTPPRVAREPGDDDDRDDDGFGWRRGEQIKHTSLTPLLDAKPNGRSST
jgi:hypothetical protein